MQIKDPQVLKDIVVEEEEKAAERFQKQSDSILNNELNSSLSKRIRTYTSESGFILGDGWRGNAPIKDRWIYLFKTLKIFRLQNTDVIEEYSEIKWGSYKKSSNLYYLQLTFAGLHNYIADESDLKVYLVENTGSELEYNEVGKMYKWQPENMSYKEWIKYKVRLGGKLSNEESHRYQMLENDGLSSTFKGVNPF